MRDAYTPSEKDVKAFQALYDAAGAQGLGFLHASEGKLDAEEARETLEAQRGYIDYHRGRVHKVDFTRWPLDLRLFDRDNGDGAGDSALARAGVS